MTEDEEIPQVYFIDYMCCPYDDCGFHFNEIHLNEKGEEICPECKRRVRI
jgi:hypothetical protein